MRARSGRWAATAFLVVLALVAAIGLTTVRPVPAGAAMGPGTFTKHTHPGIGATGPRAYYVYEPTGGAAPGQPLVVFLHGCSQTGPDAALGTRWTELAESRRFTVVFPEQSAAANGAQCWNWFLPEHQARDAGEPGVVADITRSVAASVSADPTRVYAMGISAGADEAMILGATYPDLFAAISGFAGCAYATCADVTGRLAHEAQGPRARVLPALLIQGTADSLNNFALGETMTRQWVGTNDLADDGQANGSISQQPTSVEHVGLDGSVTSGLGTVADTCVRNRQFPCASGLRANNSYPYSIEHHLDGSGCAVVDFFIIHGLNHDYPGGDPAGSFTDPAGPAVTPMAYDWFLRHQLGRPCGQATASAAPASAASAGPTSPPSDGQSGAIGAATGSTGGAARSAASADGAIHPATGGTTAAAPMAALVALAIGIRAGLRWPAGPRRRRRTGHAIPG